MEGSDFIPRHSEDPCLTSTRLWDCTCDCRLTENSSIRFHRNTVVSYDSLG